MPGGLGQQGELDTVGGMKRTNFSFIVCCIAEIILHHAGHKETEVLVSDNGIEYLLSSV